MAQDQSGKAKKGNIPGWLQLRIDNGQATEEDKALYQKLLKAKGRERAAVKGQEACPACQDGSKCVVGCVGGCTAGCLMPGQMSPS